MYTQQAGITLAAAELAELRKITKFQGKNTIFNEHPVYSKSIQDVISFPCLEAGMSLYMYVAMDCKN